MSAGPVSRGVHLPGPLSKFSLLLSFAFASAPAIMGAITIANGDYAFGIVYLAIGVVMFVLPEYITRKLPGPMELVRRHVPFLRSKRDRE